MKQDITEVYETSVSGSNPDKTTNYFWLLKIKFIIKFVILQEIKLFLKDKVLEIPKDIIVL